MFLATNPCVLQPNPAANRAFTRCIGVRGG
jgi:hypothetical protein